MVWAGVVIEVSRRDLQKPYENQRLSPVAFLSCHFSELQPGWSTLEKEANAIMATIDRMHCVLGISAGFDLCTAHHNLAFLLVPLAVVPYLSQKSLWKVPLLGCSSTHLHLYVCSHQRSS